MNKKSKLIASLMVSTAVLGVAQVEASADAPVVAQQTQEVAPEIVATENAEQQVAAEEQAVSEEQTTQDAQPVADAPALRSAQGQPQPSPAAELTGQFTETETGRQISANQWEAVKSPLQDGATWTFKDGTLTISNGNVPSLFIAPGSTSGQPSLAIFTGINQNDIKHVVFGDNVKFPADSSWMFSNANNLETVTGTPDTSAVTKVQALFWNDHKITDVSSLENWDVSNLESMMTMFFNSGTEGLNLDFSKWDTSNVKDMYAAFRGLKANSLILNGSYKTTNVETLEDFVRDSTIKSVVGLEDFDTSKVKNMRTVFFGTNIESITKLDLSKWDTSSADNMWFMFGKTNFTEIDLHGWNTDKVGNMKQMFSLNQNLEKLDISTFNTLGLLNAMDEFFKDSNKLVKINLGEQTRFNQGVQLHNIQPGWAWQNTSDPELSQPDGTVKYTGSPEFIDNYKANPAGWYVLVDTTTFAYQNDPKGQDITVEVNKNANAEDGVSNLADLTGDPTITFKDQPDTSVEGDFPATLVVTYSDGTVDEVNITIHVVPAPFAEKNDPKGQDITVEINKDANAKDGIANLDDLTGNPTIEFKEEPDTSVEGDFPATLVVTYEDGSVDEVNITIHVTPAPEEPKAPETPKQEAKKVLPATNAIQQAASIAGWMVLAPLAGLAGAAALRRKNQK